MLYVCCATSNCISCLSYIFNVTVFAFYSIYAVFCIVCKCLFYYVCGVCGGVPDCSGLLVESWALSVYSVDIW